MSECSRKSDWRLTKLLQNIDDSLNSLAVVGAQKFAQPRSPRRVAKHQRPSLGAIQGGEQLSAVVTDIPRAEPLFEPLRSAPKWLVKKWAKGESPQIADESGMAVITIYEMLKNMQKAIIRAVDGSDREMRYPLRGMLIRYIDPLEPVSDEDWDALR